MQPTSPRQPLVLGLGNVLMSDDGLGVHAVRALLDRGMSPDRCVEVGTAALKAQGLLEEAESSLLSTRSKPAAGPGRCMT